jgi:uncharacterized protein
MTPLFILILSWQNVRARSLAAIGVAAHQCGPAIEHKLACAPLTWRMAVVNSARSLTQ